MAAGMLTRKSLLVALGVTGLAAVAAIVLVTQNGSSKTVASKEGTAVPVTTAPVVTKTVPMRLTSVGNVEAYTTVSVKARVDGQIVAVRFKEGDEVKQNAILFEIDARPYVAALKQAQANQGKDKALLDRAIEQEKRYRDLLAKNFISNDAYEQVRTNVETAQATVDGDEAAIDNAKLSLDYCTIRSPVTGYAGKILIQQGNLVKANDVSPLVTVNQIVPVFATFSVPEQTLSAVREYQAQGALKVEATVPNSGKPTVTGRISFIDNAADPTTGTIKLKAEFPNVDKLLWPGQFVNIVLNLYEQAGAIVAPNTAVQNGPNGQYVFVVKPDMTVELRNIKIARADGNDSVVASGLVPGEQVVTVGQLRLAPGTKVTVGKSAQPS
jgi:multidrug efflux system membrane fusion protein